MYKPKHFDAFAMLSETQDVPENYGGAMESDSGSLWKIPIYEEMHSLEENKS